MVIHVQTCSDFYIGVYTFYTIAITEYVEALF